MCSQSPTGVSDIDIEGPQTQSARFNRDTNGNLEAFLHEYENEQSKNMKKADLDKGIMEFRRKFHYHPTKVEILKAYNKFKINNPSLKRLLMTKSSRSGSGVIVLALVTAPEPKYKAADGTIKIQKFSCKHDCSYCPKEPGQPRSYLKKEPGVQRANKVDFDAIGQVNLRFDTYRDNGHIITNIEIIVLGGTFSEYPREYQEEFIRDSIYAINTYESQGIRQPHKLQEEIEYNDLYSPIKISGITLETRPDTITLEELEWYRYLGATRIQMGVQHTDNEILKKINRGHTIEQTKAAVKLILDNGFKLDIHLMPNLPGSSPQQDIDMFTTVLNSTDLQADEWKIYPCSVVPWTDIEKWYDEKTYVPYSDEQLKEVLINVKNRVPHKIRLARVIRDIPESYISGGCKNSNMREALNKLAGCHCKCIRCREPKGEEKDITPTDEQKTMFVDKFEASEGTEYFISIENPDRTIVYGFLRLRANHTSTTNFDKQQGQMKSINDCALIRELHVYGRVKSHLDTEENKQILVIQSSGIGKALVEKAETIAREVEGYTKIAVISGIGVRNYYRKLEYVLEPSNNNNYMIKNLY